MAMFHSYVKLPEDIFHDCPFQLCVFPCLPMKISSTKLMVSTHSISTQVVIKCKRLDWRIAKQIKHSILLLLVLTTNLIQNVPLYKWILPAYQWYRVCTMDQLPHIITKPCMNLFVNHCYTILDGKTTWFHSKSSLFKVNPPFLMANHHLSRFQGKLNPPFTRK